MASGSWNQRGDIVFYPSCYSPSPFRLRPHRRHDRIRFHGPAFCRHFIFLAVLCFLDPTVPSSWVLSTPKSLLLLHTRTRPHASATSLLAQSRPSPSTQTEAVPIAEQVREDLVSPSTVCFSTPKASPKIVSWFGLIVLAATRRCREKTRTLLACRRTEKARLLSRWNWV